MRKNKLLILCLILGTVTIFSSAKQAKTEVDLYVITNPRVPTLSIALLEQRIVSLPSYDVKIKNYTYSKAKYPNLSFLPAFYFSKDLEKEAKIFEVLRKSNLVTPNKNTFNKLTYQISPYAYQPGLYLKEEKIEGQFELFYRPFCPYGIHALIGILESQKNGLKTIKKLVLTPMVTKAKDVDLDDENLPIEYKYQIANGLPELEEVVRQMIIYEKWPDKLLPYLKEREKTIFTEKNSLLRWDKAAKSASLDVKVVADLVKQEGNNILKDSVPRYIRHFITASPTYLWENIYRYNYTQEVLDQPQFKNLEINFGKASNKNAANNKSACGS